MEDAEELKSVLDAILVGMLIADNSAGVSWSTLQVLSKIVSNAASSDDPKFKQLPAKNEKIQQKVINVSGAVEFLDAIGFAREENGQGDFVLHETSRLATALVAIDDALNSLPQEQVARPSATPQQAAKQSPSPSKPTEKVTDEYEQRKIEAEQRQAQIRKKMEEDKRVKEALRAQIKAEQREVRDRPVTASHAVQITRAYAASSSSSDGKVRYTNTDKEFQSVVGSKPVVLANFTATWCGPCQAIAPMVEQMAKAQPNVTFIKIDIDENQETPARFSVTAVPTFILFKNGQNVGEVKGANAQAIQALLSKV